MSKWLNVADMKSVCQQSSSTSQVKNIQNLRHLSRSRRYLHIRQKLLPDICQAAGDFDLISSKAHHVCARALIIIIAVESLGPMNWEARKFLADLGRKISRVSGDDRETMFLFQRISVLLFRFNSVLLHNSFELDDRSEH